MRRTLLAMILACSGLMMGITGASAQSCSSITLSSNTFVNCYGNGTSVSGTITSLGNYSFGSFSGQSNGQRISGRSTSISLGDYTSTSLYGNIGSRPFSSTGSTIDLEPYSFSNSYGQVGSAPWYSSGSALQSGDFGYSTSSGRIGNTSYSSSGTSVRLGNTSSTSVTTTSIDSRLIDNPDSPSIRWQDDR